MIRYRFAIGAAGILGLGAIIASTKVLGEAGKAKKEQVQSMVQRLLSLSGMPGTDAADALGVAICHAHSMDSLALLQNVQSGLTNLTNQGLRMKRGRLVG